MGLRVWRSPSPAESREIKLEPAAPAAARSPIRRRRSPHTSPRTTSVRRVAPPQPSASRRSIRLRDDVTAELNAQLRALRAQRPPTGHSRGSSSAQTPPLPPALEPAAPARWNLNGAPLQAELATEGTYLSRAQEAGEERLRDLQREHELLAREREALDREADEDAAERNATEMRLRGNLRLHRLLREIETRSAETSSSRSRLSAAASNRSYRSPALLRESIIPGNERSPYSLYENARYAPARPTTTIENDYGVPVDPSETTGDWFNPRAMAPLREQTRDRVDEPAPRSASRPLQIPAYTTRNHSHLREGLVLTASAAPAGEVRATEPTVSAPETIIVSDFPPLRRMSGRSIESPTPAARTPRVSTRPSSGLREVWSPSSPVDGLGDRARSFSPEDSWDTMLTTIAPDATLPSADSSFTSAAASASFSAGRSTSADSSARSASHSASHSASSSQTHLTVPSRSDDWTCETDEELEDLESGIRTRVDPRNPVLRGSTSNEGTPYWRAPLTRPYEWRATSAEVSRQDVPTATSIGNTLMSGAGETPTDPDLEQLEGILERLARRDDIPDELWISAGLNPSLARNLDLFARREGTGDAGARREERERL